MDTSRRSPEKEDANTPVTGSFEGDRRSHIIEITPLAETRWQYLRRYFTTWEGWVGNYVPALYSTSLLGSSLLTSICKGLSLSHYPEYLAAEQAVQGLRSTILRLER